MTNCVVRWPIYGFVEGFEGRNTGIHFDLWDRKGLKQALIEDTFWNFWREGEQGLLSASAHLGISFLSTKSCQYGRSDHLISRLAFFNEWRR